MADAPTTAVADTTPTKLQKLTQIEDAVRAAQQDMENANRNVTTAVDAVNGNTTGFAGAVHSAVDSAGSVLTDVGSGFATTGQDGAAVAKQLGNMGDDPELGGRFIPEG